MVENNTQATCLSLYFELIREKSVIFFVKCQTIKHQRFSLKHWEREKPRQMKYRPQVKVWTGSCTDPPVIFIFFFFTWLHFELLTSLHMFWICFFTLYANPLMNVFYNQTINAFINSSMQWFNKHLFIFYYVPGSMPGSGIQRCKYKTAMSKNWSV